MIYDTNTLIAFYRKGIRYWHADAAGNHLGGHSSFGAAAKNAVAVPSYRVIAVSADGSTVTTLQTAPGFFDYGKHHPA